MRFLAWRAWAGLCLAILVSLMLPSSGKAQSDKPSLQIAVPLSGASGARVPLTAQLKHGNGQPMQNERILFLVDGTRDGEARTDQNGVATWRVRRSLPAGTHQLEAVWEGAAATRAALQLVVAPAQLALQVEPAAPQAAEPITATIRLHTAAGQPIADARVALLIDGAPDGAARTDANGQAIWRVTRHLPADKYKIGASFEGVGPVLSASASQEVVVGPAQVEVRTVPPSPGAQFTLAGRSMDVDHTGLARGGVAQSGVYSLTVQPTVAVDPSVRLDFERWSDGIYEPQRNVKVPIKEPLQADFTVSKLVSLSFVDPQGKPVDPTRVMTLTLTSNTGERYVLNHIAPVWLQARRMVRVGDSVEQRDLEYAVESAFVDGANVVQQSQQRFVPSSRTEWQVELLLYSVHFSARDALFGFPAGTALALEYPDGRINTLPLGRSGELTLDGLARGDYRVKVVSRGMSTTQPLALSRSDDVPLLVISYLDMGVVGGLLGATALGLLVAGRLRFLRGFLRRSAPWPSSGAAQVAEGLVTEDGEVLVPVED